MAAPRILVVDDDPMTVDLIKAYLEKEHWQVLTADNGRDALDIAREKQPDLIVLDLMLPRVDGLDVTRILRTNLDIPIVMLTARSTEDDILLGLELGADDYVTKPFSPRQLVARVRTVLRRNRSLQRDSQDLLQFGDLSVSLARHEVRIRDQEITLTPREFKLLVLMVREPGRVFSRQQLLEGAFGSDTESLERTVDYHIMNLRRKLEYDKEISECIQTVFGVGYRFTYSPAAQKS
ncbi:MAG: response regulator transcription factor [Chloroflexi bacterium]|jgi:DNA-binding response OmpR family regulator|nr:MAG: two component transcriptional regulator [Chloroflexi bacterium OLB13]MBV6435711.1 Transcriptional regulatory protein SrrA [Anaerolineae bacterium]MCC6564692.1 response regulator transcription factor [Chloroflexota bacterium]MDL1914998.1 response regulator transcription factor [Anaerolineae bacterium CFX4]OQY80071.1 MAG: DNA-binding response regulator [Anaerolineae bacterium UTCFX5]